MLHIATSHSHSVHLMDDVAKRRNVLVYFSFLPELFGQTQLTAVLDMYCSNLHLLHTIGKRTTATYLEYTRGVGIEIVALPKVL